MKIIYDMLNRPTLVNDINDKFTQEVDFMMAFSQLNLLGLKQKITVKKKISCSTNPLVEEEVWDLNL